jgi:O-6-methylguanine DNA methyltransferase
MRTNPIQLYKVAASDIDVIYICPANFGFGRTFVGVWRGTLVALAYERAELDELLGNFPNAQIVHQSFHAKQLEEDYFHNRKLIATVTGSDFQFHVWNALCTIPVGKTVSYKEIAYAIGRPTAYRAVGNAVGANPISYFVPCHRVVASDGSLGGYRWGIDKKRQLLDFDADLHHFS